jgi:DNA-binding GntR family transcriptional regulator
MPSPSAYSAASNAGSATEWPRVALAGAQLESDSPRHPVVVTDDVDSYQHIGDTSALPPLTNVRRANTPANRRHAKASAIEAAKVSSEGIVDQIHREVRHMAIMFRILPGERLNESILAKELGVNRVRLREALNRLSTEGFLTFSAHHGFFRKPLEVKEVFDLYEFRQQMEMAAVRLVVVRASNEQLLELERFVNEGAESTTDRILDGAVSLDAEFHQRLIALTENREMLDSLSNANARIYYVHRMEMNGRSSELQTHLKKLARALSERDTEECMRLITERPVPRLDDIIDLVGRCYGRIYGQRDTIWASLPAR